MKKALLFSLLYLCSNVILFSQPCQISDDYPGPLVCGSKLNPLFGSNEFFTADFGFSCGDPHNNGWFQFEAEDTEVEFEFFFSNCRMNQGLQVAILNEFGNTLACFSVQSLFSGTISAQVQPCEIYTMMIDGYASDICDFTIFARKGIDVTDGPYLPVAATCNISGPTNNVGCSPPPTASYKLECPPCYDSDSSCPADNLIDSTCIEYVWTLPRGMTLIGSSNNGAAIEVSITGSVFGFISVEILNHCSACGCAGCGYTIDPLFVNFTGRRNIPQPPEFVCPGDSVEICGNFYTASQTAYCNLGGCVYSSTDVILDPRCSVPPVGDSCFNAPFYCGENLDGLSFPLFGYNPVTPGDLEDVLSFSVENNKWLSFSPCESEVEFQINASLCGLTAGVEAAILQTADCQQFTLFDELNVVQGNAVSWSVNNLIPGEVYYLMVDGIGGDKCNVEIDVISGINTDPVVINEITPGYIDGPEKLCPGEIGTYTLIPPVIEILGGSGCPFPDTIHNGIAGNYVWHIPDDAHFVGDSTGLSIQIIFNIDEMLALIDTIPNVDTTLILTSGFVYPTFEIDSLFGPDVFCDVSGNLTGIAPKRVKVCIRIDVEDFEICEGESFDFHGMQLTESGTYTHYEDCLLEVLSLTVKPVNNIDWGTMVLCPWECFTGNDGWTVCDQGFHSTPYGCGQQTVEIIYMNSQPPQVVNLDESCDTDGLTYMVSFEIIGGSGLYSVNGLPVSGNTFTQAGILSGDSYNFLITDVGMCGSQVQISGSRVCTPPCLYQPAILANSTIEVCEGESAFAQNIGEEVIPPGGMFEYVLHSGSGSIFADILDRNQTGEFNFDESQMDFEITYFISQIVGESINGTVNPNDPCTRVSNPQAVVFHKNPEISAIDASEINCKASISLLTCESDADNFEWTNSNGFYSDLQIAQTSVPGFYQLMVESQYGCRSETTIEVVEVIEPIVEIRDLKEECSPDGSFFTVSFDIESGTPPFYVNGVQIAGTEFKKSGIPAGDSYLFDVSDNGNCDYQTELSGSVDCSWVCPFQPAVLAGDLQETCEGEPAFAENLGGEVYPIDGTYEYILHSSRNSIFTTVLDRNQTGEFHFDKNRMSYEVNYYITHVVGESVNGQVELSDPCTKFSNEQEIVFYKNPIISHISASSITCIDSLAELVCNADAQNFEWTNSDGFYSDLQTPSTTAPGTYSLTVENEFGCRDNSTVEVFQFENTIEDLIFDMLDPTCYNRKDGFIELIEVVGNDEPFIIKIDGVEMDDQTVIDHLGGGDYLLEVIDQYGCGMSKLLTLEDPIKPMVELGEDLEIDRGEVVTIESQSNISPAEIVWVLPSGEKTIGNSEMTVTPLESSSYTIEIKDENGCSAFDRIFISVADPTVNIYVPSGFSPNGDGINDYFEIFANDRVVKIQSLHIFNRWGDLIFEQKDYLPNQKERNWDGTYKGQPLNSGVFTFVAKLELTNSESAVVKGDLTLIR